ncbi:MAG: glycosyltransferase, partial [Rikenellaceae bacterium]
GVGWHWVLEMSKYFDLWVLTRESNRESIEGWFAENSIDNKPTFIYFDLPKKLRFWKKGLRGVRTYYMLWQSLTNRLVKQTMQENGIEIYHLLTYGNALWPASSYGQRQAFIWGPTSAGTYVDADFTKHYGFKNRAKEAAQRLMAKTLTLNCGFKKRCKCAKLILCKTEQTRQSIPEEYRSKAVLFTDVAIDLFDTSKYVSKRKDDTVRYLAVGRLDSWRGFDLMIEAFAKALKQNENLHLDILGKGSDRERLQTLISKLNLEEKVVLRGHVTMEEYYQYMADCDVVVNPTLKEGAVTTAFDSMSFATPMICIDTGGYTRYFTHEYAEILQIKSRATTIENLTTSMLKLTDSSLREEMSKKIVAVRDNFIWERKGEEIRDIILKTINE